MEKSLDVVIPSFRLNEKELLPILLLKKPEDFEIKFIVIADNPAIQIPKSIENLASEGKVHLIINETNLGFSATRNKGIDAGNADWLLLLDDDIVTKEDLLIVFCEAIRHNPSALGYIGITNFPPPINAVTKAFHLNTGGQYNVGHFKNEHIWFPTANIALNRQLLGNRRFQNHLIKGGEDIEFFSRNCFENDRRYISLPEATVIHPWWNNGKSQLKRMFNYGWGTSDIICTKYLKRYSYFDFPNTTESIIFLTLISILIFPLTGNLKWLLVAIGILVLAEYLTNLIKSIVLTKDFSPEIAFQMMLYKNANELGYIRGCLHHKMLSYLTKRLDVSFRKVRPSPFRLNRWKIIKLFLIILLTIVSYLTWS